MKDYSLFLDPEEAYLEIKLLLISRLDRQLTDLEERKLKWLSDCEYETIGVIFDLFKELSEEKGA